MVYIYLPSPIPNFRVDAIRLAQEERETVLTANRANPLDEELIKTKGMLRAPGARREGVSRKNSTKRDSKEIKETQLPTIRREEEEEEGDCGSDDDAGKEMSSAMSDVGSKMAEERVNGICDAESVASESEIVKDESSGCENKTDSDVHGACSASKNPGAISDGDVKGACLDGGVNGASEKSSTATDGENRVENNLRKSSELSSECCTHGLLVNSVDKSGDKSKDKSSDKSINKSSDKSIDKSSDKSVDKSSVKSVDKSSDNSVDKSSEKSVDKSSDNPGDKSSGKSVDKSSDMSIDKSSDKSVDKSSDKCVDRSSEKSVDKSSDKSVDKSSDKPSDKSSIKSGDKSTADIVSNDTSCVTPAGDSAGTVHEKSTST